MAAVTLVAGTVGVVGAPVVQATNVGHTGTPAPAIGVLYAVNSNADQAFNSNDCSGTAPCTLRDAIGKANTTGGNSTILFKPSVKSPIVLNKSLGELEVTNHSSENVTIVGTSPLVTVVDGNHGTRILFVDSGATVSLITMTLRNGLVSGGDQGGAVYNAGSLTVTDSTLSGNSAGSGSGGAIFNYSQGIALTVTNSTLSGNTASDGGAIFNANTSTVTNTTLSGNNASSGLGGGAIYSNGTSTVTNSTLSGNKARNGAAILNGIGTSTVTDSTLSGNSATNVGGAIYTFGGTPTATNSIVADNTASSGPNCSGLVTDGGYNLENGTSCVFSNHAVNAEPRLGPLQNNGGPTQTQAILVSSPAFAKGNNTVCTTAEPGGAGGKDQRGLPRNNEFPGDTSRCDIGAYEATPPTVSAVSPNYGPVTGGTPITITGRNFFPGAKVVIGQGTGTIGAIAARNVKVVSSSKITATTGGGAKAGTWRLFVITSGGTSAGNSGDLFTYK